ncbi:MAG: ABC transporter ATP-binding protein [Lachnospiraceae bacterium]|nr:ABC transporter ATP-binding protein [Lachnospiraceae bacterium]
MKNNYTQKADLPFFSIVANNFFLLKKCYKIAPLYMILIVFDAIRGKVSIFLEHTIGIGIILGAFERGDSFAYVAYFLIMLVLFISLGLLYNVIVQNYVAEKNLPIIHQKIKMELYEKAKDVDLAFYDNPEFYDNYILCMAEVDNQIDRSINMLQNFAGSITMFLSVGGFFLLKDRVAFLVVLISFVGTYVLNLLCGKISYKMKIEEMSYSKKREYIKRIFYTDTYAKEMRIRRGFIDKFISEFEQANDAIYQIEKKYSLRLFVLNFLRKYFFNSFITESLLLLYLVVRVVVYKELSIATMVVMFNSVGNLKKSMYIFTDIFPYAYETSLYVQKIRDFLSKKSQIIDEGTLKLSHDALDIRIENVSFGYKGQENVIKNISLHIKPEEKIALVGTNGAGKTTLIKLLMRLYDPTEGSILVNGISIKEYSVESYRKTIAGLFQDFAIFPTTLGNNVVLDRMDDSERGRVKEALRLSGFGDKLSNLKDGLDTELTCELKENGINLSGGEKQKAALGRIFFRNSGLVIMDEPSSALDPIAEYQLNHTMQDAAQDKTVIFISHRLTTTRMADRIIVMDHGSIAEEGKHKDLLERNGIYAEMWKMQAAPYLGTE